MVFLMVHLWDRRKYFAQGNDNKMPLATSLVLMELATCGLSGDDMTIIPWLMLLVPFCLIMYSGGPAFKDSWAKIHLMAMKLVMASCSSTWLEEETVIDLPGLVGACQMAGPF